MSRYPKATFDPTPNMTRRGLRRPIKGVVLHIAQGSYEGTIAWLKNPQSGASSHFVNAKDGRLTQLVDTADMAWAQMAGNGEWVSIEHEGMSGEALTPQQYENDAEIYAWLVRDEAIPLQITNDVNVLGLGYHAMGGSAWGGHPDCPGPPIIDIRQSIIARAHQLVYPVPPQPPQETTVPAATWQTLNGQTLNNSGKGFSTIANDPVKVLDCRVVVGNDTARSPRHNGWKADGKGGTVVYWVDGDPNLVFQCQFLVAS
jgi:hypothetical protein